MNLGTFVCVVLFGLHTGTKNIQDYARLYHGFQNRTGPGGRTVKTGNRDENRFLKPKEPDFLLIP